MTLLGGGIAGKFRVAYVIFMLKCSLINVRFQQHPLPLLNLSVFRVLNTVFKTQHFKKSEKRICNRFKNTVKIPQEEN